MCVALDYGLVFGVKHLGLHQPIRASINENL